MQSSRQLGQEAIFQTWNRKVRSEKLYRRAFDLLPRADLRDSDFVEALCCLCALCVTDSLPVVYPKLSSISSNARLVESVLLARTSATNFFTRDAGTPRTAAVSLTVGKGDLIVAFIGFHGNSTPKCRRFLLGSRGSGRATSLPLVLHLHLLHFRNLRNHNRPHPIPLKRNPRRPYILPHKRRQLLSLAVIRHLV
jgi:hypothetical protein